MLLCLGLGVADEKRVQDLLIVAVPVFFLLGVAYLVPSLVGGLLLLVGQRPAARWVLTLPSALMVPLLPVGTALGLATLWALYRRAEDPPAPPRVVAQRTGDPPPDRNVKGLALTVALVGSGFVVALGAGFRLHGQPPPEPLLGVGFWPAIPVFVASAVALIVLRPFAPTPRPARPLNPFWLYAYRRRMKRETEAWRAERARRIAELAADPGRRRYAALMEAGETWTDEQIAYDQDPDAAATCAHLQPVERAMRAAGVAVRLQGPSRANADCRIDEPALRARFDLPAEVTYVEMFLGGRAVEDDPIAYLRCVACESGIDTVHPRAARADTPVFPSP